MAESFFLKTSAILGTFGDIETGINVSIKNEKTRGRSKWSHNLFFNFISSFTIGSNEVK